MLENVPESLVARLQATSYALSLRQNLQDIADEVYDLTTSGATEREVNRRIHEWMQGEGCLRL